MSYEPKSVAYYEGALKAFKEECDSLRSLVRQFEDHVRYFDGRAAQFKALLEDLRRMRQPKSTD